MEYHVMEYMGRMVRKTCLAVVIGFVMLILMGQAQSRRAMAASAQSFDAGPWSAEFALTRDDGAAVGLGVQEGAFPWNSGLEARESAFRRSGGQDFFDISADDGSEFSGTRRDGVADESGGLLLEIRTANPEWKTRRGAYAGMSMEETLALYPEAAAEYDAHREAGSYRYTYSGTKKDKTSGISRITFLFEDNVLASMALYHAAD